MQGETVLERIRANTITSLESLSHPSLNFQKLIEALLVNKSLTKVCSSFSIFDITVLDALFDAITKLESLKVFGLYRSELNSSCGPLIDTLLRNHLSLESLDLSDNYLLSEGVVAFSGALTVNKSLKRLVLQSNSIDHEGVVALCQALESNHTLQELSLSDNLVQWEGAQAIAKLLKTTSSLTHFYLGRNGLEDEAIGLIFDAMALNSSVVDLGMDGSNPETSIHSARSLLNMLESNTTLQELNLSFNTWGREVGKAIGEGLKRNKTLSDLSLNSCGFDAHSVRDVSEGLIDNRSLTVIDLSYNQMSDEGVEYLVQCLKLNQTLSRLSIADIGMGPIGAVLFFKVLESANCRIAHLNMAFNNIGNEGVRGLAQMLMKNTTLKVIFFDLDNATEGMPYIASALKQNTVVRNFVMAINKMTPADVLLMEEALEHNGSITSCPHVTEKLEAICKRNVAMHEMTRMCVLTLLALRRWKKTWLNDAPKEIVAMVAMCMWKAKCQLTQPVAF